MFDQFADAPADGTTINVIENLTNIPRDPTGATAYIDDPIDDDIPDTESDASLEEYDSEDEREWRAAADHGVDDEDWEIAEKGKPCKFDNPLRSCDTCTD
jgi:hypothetical protein